MAETNHDIIKYNANQDAPIKLDLTNNQIIFNNSVDDVLNQTQDLVAKGEALTKTDINQIDETQMTKLNKEIKPITKIQNDYLDTRKKIKKELQNRDDAILAAFDDKLNQHHFNEIQSIVKKLHVLQKDFKANRANQRWDQVKEYFDAQMELYPEFQQYAPQSLGSFNYYRIHHSDLVSEAKTKPVNKATIKTLNDELYQYHNDLKHLFDSNLSKVYYQGIIDEYANDPSTNKIMDLIQKAQVQQIKDQNVQASHVVDQLVEQLWSNNPKINQLLMEQKPANVDLETFTVQKQNLMQSNAQALSQSIDLNQFMDNNQLNQAKVETQLKTNIKTCFATVAKALTQVTPKIKSQNLKSKPDPYQWVLDYLQVNHWANIHDNDQIKAQVLRDLYTTITDANSVWKQHIQSNHELIALTQYLINL